MPCLEFLPLQIHIVIGKLQSVHDIIFVCTVKHRRGHIETQSLRRKGKVNLQHLPDVHTGRHAQRIQHDIQRTSVGQIRHILHGQHPGDHTLVSMTACHLVAYRNLSLLCNINSDCLIYAGRQLIAVLSGKHLSIHYNTVFAVGNLQGSVPHLSGLLTENRPKQPLLCGQLRLSLGSDLAYQNIACPNLCADANDSSVIQILQGLITHPRHVSGNLLRPQLRISGLCLIFLDMNRCIHIVLHQPFAQQNGVLIVVALPGHESDQRVLAQSQLAHSRGWTVRDNLPLRHMVALEHNGLLIIAVGLVASGELGQAVLHLLSVIASHTDQSGGYIVHRACLSGHNTVSGVHGGLGLHACTHHGSLRQQQRHSLTLHVGSHQRTVGIVVLKEGNQRGSHGEHHSG